MMRQRLQYLYVEVKKTIGMFPRMLLWAILLMFLIGMIAFCGTKSMEQEPLAVTADIGVVVREENPMTRMALGYVENLESVSKVCRFVRLSEEEGFRRLERQEVAALIVLPEQLIEGIMNGNNPVVDIFFPQNAGLETLLFRELTQSGAGLLRVAQAQIYGAYDVAEEYGLKERLSVMETEIDSYNLAFALDRLAIYDSKEVAVTGKMNVLQYYTASGVVLFLLLTGMAVYPVMKREPKAFCEQLKREGQGFVWQGFCRWLCGFMCMSLFVIAAMALLTLGGAVVPSAWAKISSALSGRGNGYPVGIWCMVFFAILVTVSSLIYLVYGITGSRTGSILLIFLLSVTMVYLSGGLVPSMFLPKVMQQIGSLMPTTYLIRALGGLFAGYADGQLVRCIMALWGYTAVFGIVSLGMERLQNWRAVL